MKTFDPEAWQALDDPKLDDLRRMADAAAERAKRLCDKLDQIHERVEALTK